MSKDEHLLYLGLGAVAAAALALVWLTGALAGVLFGTGWITVEASELAMTALRLPLHPGDPRDAWPSHARSELPGAVGFYLSSVLIVVALAGVALAVRRILIPFDLPELGREERRAPTAHWARLKDLAPLRVPAPQPGRLTLGRVGRDLIAAEERASVIVFAPTGTHKTTGLAIPALVEWQGPVLVTSVKGDLLEATIEAREQIGEVMVFDPVGVTGMGLGAQMTPLWGAGTWHGARQVAHWLCEGAQSGKGGLKDADFWYATAEKLLAPLLFAAATSGMTMGDVVRWLDEGPEANGVEVAGLLRAAGVGDAELAWQATQNREERQRSSVYTTAEVIVSAYADERVRQRTRDAEYTPERLLDGGRNTLYLCAPLQEQERLRPLFSMPVQQLLNFAYEQAARNGRPIDPPLLLLLDEAANIAPLQNLDAIASTGASQGVQVLSIFHDMAQLATVYGSRAPTVANNHRGKIIGVGVTDPQTHAYVSRGAGLAAFEQLSQTSGERGRRSSTRGPTYRDLAPANVIREQAPGSALLMYHNLPLAKFQLRLWFDSQNFPDRDEVLSHSHSTSSKSPYPG